MDTTPQIKRLVLQKHREGMSLRSISSDLHMPKSTVHDIIRRNTTESHRIGRCGRRRILSVADERLLARCSSRDPRMTARQLQNEAGNTFLNVSLSTIQRSLNRSGLLAYRPVAAPSLSSQQRQTRLVWARKYIHWSPQDWCNVVFSDESAFDIAPPRSQLVRRRKNSLIQAEHTRQHRPYLRRVMFWGCFSGLGVGPLEAIEGTMNSEKYLVILRHHLVPKIQQWFGLRIRTCTYQQDNAPCHKSQAVKAFLQNQRFATMEWPPYSPDLSPIENLWAIIKAKLHIRATSTPAELTQRVLQIWNDEATMGPHVRALAESMPRRVRACIDNNGGPINY